MPLTIDRTIPRGEASSAVLVFPRGVADLHVCAGGTEHLASGTFSAGRPPEITSSRGTLSVRNRRGVGRARGELRLNPEVEWSIESHSGASGLTADLTGLQLAGVRLAGGASRVWLDLPRTAQPVPIEFARGAHRVNITRPADVGAVLQIRDGASSLVFDDEQLGAVSGELRLESTTRGVAGEYQITARRGVSRLSVSIGRVGRVPFDGSCPRGEDSVI